MEGQRVTFCVTLKDGGRCVRLSEEINRQEKDAKGYDKDSYIRGVGEWDRAQIRCSALLFPFGKWKRVGIWTTVVGLFSFLFYLPVIYSYSFAVLYCFCSVLLVLGAAFPHLPPPPPPLFSFLLLFLFLPQPTPSLFLFAPHVVVGKITPETTSHVDA